MSGQSTETGERDAKLICKKCKTASLRRRTPNFLNQFTSFYPYSCSRCGNQQKKFRFTVATISSVIIVGVIVAAGVWLSGYRPPFATGAEATSQSDQTEALARARSNAGGGLSTYEQMMLHKPKGSMDNATVLKLVKANVPKDVILQMIHTSNADYDVTANAIIDLKDAGVDREIILAMIGASSTPH